MRSQKNHISHSNLASVDLKNRIKIFFPNENFCFQKDEIADFFPIPPSKCRKNKKRKTKKRLVIIG